MKTTQLQNKIVDEAFKDRTSLMALAWGSVLAAHNCGTKQKSYMALFLLPSLLSLLPKNCFSDVKSTASGETPSLLALSGLMVFGCHIWTVPSFYCWGGVCWHQLNISGKSQWKDLVACG